MTTAPAMLVRRDPVAPYGSVQVHTMAGSPTIDAHSNAGDRPPLPRLGAWCRADGMVGVVARVDGDRVTVFDPAQRREHEVAASAVTAVPTAAVRITTSVDLPVPHGLDEHDLRRWIAMLTDPVLRERAGAALAAAGLDPGVTLPQVSVTATALDDGASRCLCGTTTASATTAPAGASPPACPTCGRQVAPPVPPMGA